MYKYINKLIKKQMNKETYKAINTRVKQSIHM